MIDLMNSPGQSDCLIGGVEKRCPVGDVEILLYACRSSAYPCILIHKDLFSYLFSDGHCWKNTSRLR